MKELITIVFAGVSIFVAMLLGKCLVSTRDLMTRLAVIIGSLLLWTACVWLLLLYWRGDFERY